MDEESPATEHDFESDLSHSHTGHYLPADMLCIEIVSKHKLAQIILSKFYILTWILKFY
jgi:hypothetical protein